MLFRKELTDKLTYQTHGPVLTCPPLFSVRNWYCTLWSVNAACGTPVMVTAVCSSVPTVSPVTGQPTGQRVPHVWRCWTSHSKHMREERNVDARKTAEKHTLNKHMG